MQRYLLWQVEGWELEGSYQPVHNRQLEGLTGTHLCSVLICSLALGLQATLAVPLASLQYCHELQGMACTYPTLSGICSLLYLPCRCVAFALIADLVALRLVHGSPQAA